MCSGNSWHRQSIIDCSCSNTLLTPHWLLRQLTRQRVEEGAQAPSICRQYISVGPLIILESMDVWCFTNATSSIPFIWSRWLLLFQSESPSPCSQWYYGKMKKFADPIQLEIVWNIGLCFSHVSLTLNGNRFFHGKLTSKVVSHSENCNFISIFRKKLCYWHNFLMLIDIGGSVVYKAMMNLCFIARNI